MSGDLVRRLWKGVADTEQQQDAADRIEALEAENKRLRDALALYACKCSTSPGYGCSSNHITFCGHAARAALEGKG